MSMKDETGAGADLEPFFAAARACPPEPSAALLARVAQAAQRPQQGPVRGPVAPRATLAERLGALLGGWPAMAGLAAAVLVGLWIGAGLPAAVVPGAAEAGYLVDIAPELAFDLAGGGF
jgi:hypothetical protein